MAALARRAAAWGRPAAGRRRGSRRVALCTPPHRQAGPTPGEEGLGDGGALGGSVRRTVTVEFTCNKCDARTQRQVNPHALAKGTIYLQCGGCEAWHTLVDNMELVEEYDLRDHEVGEQPPPGPGV